MTCSDARDMFSLLADDALTPLERAALDAHLADCAECRRELASFERTVKLVRAIDPANAPAGFVERVLAAAQANRPAPQQPKPLQERPPRLPEQPEQPAQLPDRPVLLPERRPARRRAWPWPTLPLGAAALFVVGGLAALLFRGSPEQQRAAQRQLESPPPVTAPAPPSEAPPPAPAPPSRDELQKPAAEKPAAPASKPPKTAAKPPGAGKRAETSVAEKKSLPDEQRNVAPPQVAERFGAKMESSERAQDKDKRDIAQEPLAKGRSDAAPSPAQDAIQPAPASPSRDRQAAAAKVQTSPLSRTGPMTGIPAAASDVAAQLRVANVSAGERSLIALAVRAGGRQTGRRIDAGRIVVELAVPRDAYPQFVREAAALGSMSIERQEATDRPMLAVAVTLSN
jgi:hypothetical protein